MIRVFALAAVLFFAADAILCPVACLADEAATHQTPNALAQGSSSVCGGACPAGSPAVRAYVPGAVSPADRSAPDFRAVPPVPGHTLDIDHPPRLV